MARARVPQAERKKPGPKKGQAKGNEGRVPPARLARVRQCIADCWSHAKIVNTLKDEWKVSDRTIRNYLKRVYAELRIYDEDYQLSRRDRIREVVQEHYVAAMKAGNLREAGRDADRLLLLEGLKVHHLELTGPGGAPFAAESKMQGNLTALTDEQLKLLAPLFATSEPPAPPPGAAPATKKP